MKPRRLESERIPHIMLTSFTSRHIHYYGDIPDRICCSNPWTLFKNKKKKTSSLSTCTHLWEGLYCMKRSTRQCTVSCYFTYITVFASYCSYLQYVASWSICTNLLTYPYLQWFHPNCWISPHNLLPFANWGNHSQAEISHDCEEWGAVGKHLATLDSPSEGRLCILHRAPSCSLPLIGN